jgi:bifunctional non-homologous end joining protein LigD
MNMNGTTETWQIARHSVKVTHLDKLYWPAGDQQEHQETAAPVAEKEEGITKGDLLHYYRDMAPVLLPYLQNRPVTLRLFPDGVQGFSYYRREMPQNAPRWIRSVSYRPKTTPRSGQPTSNVQLPVIDDAAGLIWLANQGCIEFHPWGSRLANLTQPDLAIFDLDSGDEATFAEVLAAALHVHESLQHLGLRAYAKTTGGKGLHVYVPVAPGQTFARLRTWVKTVAQHLAATFPDLIAVARGATRSTHRGGQVTIDYAQNSIGRNTAAPYTVRARPYAPVSAPVSWDEVEAGHLLPTDFTMPVMSDRVRRLGDLFAPVLGAGQDLPDLS